MLFSILIPAYKILFLKDAIESVLSQQYTDFELVVVDDCSPEDLGGIVGMFDDPRIRYYKNAKNYGAKDVVENWNKCLGYAKGDYVICMGDDDLLLPNCLMDYYNCIQSHPGFNVYHIRTVIINENGNIVDLQEARPPFETVYSLLWHRLTKSRIQFIGDFLFEKSSLLQRGGFYKLPYACYSDDISVCLASKDRGIVNINRIGFQYRRNNQTITNTQDLKVVVESIQLAVKWMRLFLKDIPDSENDALYRKLILNMLTSYEKSMCDYCFMTDMRKSLFRGMFFWWSHHALYGISKRHYCNVLINSIISFVFKQ